MKFFWVENGNEGQLINKSYAHKMLQTEGSTGKQDVLGCYLKLNFEEVMQL